MKSRDAKFAHSFMALVLINPVCGDRSAPAFIDQHVLPLLNAANISYDLATTTAPDSSGPIVAAHPSPTTVILASGDGTLHELVNYSQLTPPLNIVLVPCGTANALYASLFPGVDTATPEGKLHSLHAFLENRPTKPLSLARMTIEGSSKEVNAAVVVSTALHAAILHDSEELRSEHPGIERYASLLTIGLPILVPDHFHRFKIAAQKNSTVWYNASVKLHGPVQIYNPATKAFEPFSFNTLSGPFVYFLSTVNVDRLEPAFVITPLARRIPPPPQSEQATCDIVVLRPLRDPLLSTGTDGARQAYAATTWAALTDAYQNGAHIDLTYAPNTDKGVQISNVGPTLSDKPVLEYFRCTGWDWSPVLGPEGTSARFVCTDGTITHIPEGKTVVCNALANNRDNPAILQVFIFA